MRKRKRKEKESLLGLVQKRRGHSLIGDRTLIVHKVKKKKSENQSLIGRIKGKFMDLLFPLNWWAHFVFFTDCCYLLNYSHIAYCLSSQNNSCWNLSILCFWIWVICNLIKEWSSEYGGNNKHLVNCAEVLELVKTCATAMTLGRTSSKRYLRNISQQSCSNPLMITWRNWTTVGNSLTKHLT